MTDEKKPHQEVAAEIAQIVIDLDASGLMRLTASCFGQPDSSYTPVLSDRALAFDLPCLVHELQLQLRERRHATMAETLAIRSMVRQGESGSAVTV